jgi:hypothetical protein
MLVDNPNEEAIDTIWKWKVTKNPFTNDSSLSILPKEEIERRRN